MHVRETVVVLFSNGLAPKCKELFLLALSAEVKDADRRTKQVFKNKQIGKQTHRETKRHIERQTHRETDTYRDKHIQRQRHREANT
jgi:hypothetical protein